MFSVSFRCSVFCAVFSQASLLFRSFPRDTFCLITLDELIEVVFPSFLGYPTLVFVLEAGTGLGYTVLLFVYLSSLHEGNSHD